MGAQTLLLGMAGNFAGTYLAALPMGIFQMLVLENGHFKGLRGNAANVLWKVWVIVAVDSKGLFSLAVTLIDTGDFRSLRATVHLAKVPEFS